MLAVLGVLWWLKHRLEKINWQFSLLTSFNDNKLFLCAVCNNKHVQDVKSFNSIIHASNYVTV